MFLKENTTESVKKSKKSKKMDKPEKCPLCCENLEPDDLNFLPCPCGYKVCLFCWNRIRTSENDPKCPLCRRTYSENPAKFEPLSAEQLQKLKNKKKQEDVKKKQKLAEDRKQLADVRVVRKNLIFVNDLPLNFSKDPKLYQRFLNIFKQAGHIKKTSILNSSKNYAGQKAPYARAYITYQKNEEALKALKMFENVEFEGKELKLSLGTTKYCSNYIKNVNCTNKECVYLHEQADVEASFTKEQIHAGKHIEYGQRLYEQYVNSLHAKSISNAISEEKKSETQSHHVEDVEKDIITEIPISPSTSQQNNQSLIQNERDSSPIESESLRALKHLQDIVKANNFVESSSTSNNSRDTCDPFQKFMTMNSTPVNSSSTDSLTDLAGLNQVTKMDIPNSAFENRYNVSRDLIPNGNPFHEEGFSLKKESLLSRLNLISNNHGENNLRSGTDEFRSSFPKDVGSHSYVNSDLTKTIDLKLECKDDCGLDFDPVQMALGGLGELVISEKQKARVDVNSLNSTPVNAFKKQPFPTPIQPQSSNISSYKTTSNQPLQPKIQQQQQQQPVFSPNNFMQNNMPSTVFQQQSRSQTSPVVDYFSQQAAAASFRPSSVQTTQRSSASSSSQRSQIPFGNALSIQLPRVSPGMSVSVNSMVNGYSPQQYLSQISPQEAYLLSQQQQQQQPQQQPNQSFENYSQQYSNFDQINSSQVFGVNALQNQSMRDFGGSSTLNMSLGQRIRSEAIGRQQSYQQQQQQQQFQQLQQQRINSFCNSTPQSETLSRPKGSSTFIP